MPLIIAFDPGFNNPRRYALEPSTTPILGNFSRSHSPKEENKGKEIGRPNRWRNIVDETGSGAQTLGGVELRYESNSNKYRIYLALNSRWRWWRLTIPRGLFSNNPDYSRIFDGELAGASCFAIVRQSALDSASNVFHSTRFFCVKAR